MDGRVGGVVSLLITLLALTTYDSALGRNSGPDGGGKIRSKNVALAVGLPSFSGRRLAETNRGKLADLGTITCSGSGGFLFGRGVAD